MEIHSERFLSCFINCDLFGSDGYDVSGMPDPYMDHQMDPNMAAMHHDNNMAPPQDNKPQISFDESLESGYSTPNSRNRRIIREIIV